MLITVFPCENAIAGINLQLYLVPLLNPVFYFLLKSTESLI